MTVVLIADPVGKGLKEMLARAGIDAKEEAELDRSALLEIVKKVDGIVVRGRTQVDAEVIQTGTNLKIIARYGVGLDNIDLKAAKDYNIPVVNAAAAPSQSVAELALALMLAVLRKIPTGDAGIRRGQWLKKGLTGNTLHGKTVGIVGTGAIGQSVAKMTLAVGAKVIGYDVKQYDEVLAMGVSYVEWDDLLTRADLISIHVPLLPATTKMFNTGVFNKMKSTAILINTSRGRTPMARRTLICCSLPCSDAYV